MYSENIAALRGLEGTHAAQFVAGALLHPAVRRIVLPGDPVMVAGERVPVDIDLDYECDGRPVRGGVLLLHDKVGLSPEEVVAAVDEARSEGRHLVAVRPTSLGKDVRRNADGVLRQIGMPPVNPRRCQAVLARESFVLRSLPEFGLGSIPEAVRWLAACGLIAFDGDGPLTTGTLIIRRKAMTAVIARGPVAVVEDEPNGCDDQRGGVRDAA